MVKIFFQPKLISTITLIIQNIYLKYKNVYFELITDYFICLDLQLV